MHSGEKCSKLMKASTQWEPPMSTIFWMILLAIAGLLIYAATRPNSFRIERSTVIDAKPDALFNLLSDFRAWRKWSPWEDLDPELKRTYSGSDAGVGAIYAWEGNSKAGSGRMEIAEAKAKERVLVNLDFLKPFKASNKAEFTLAPTAGGTRVNWAMYGPQPFMMRLMGIFMNAEKFLGPQFEQGLANLKREAELKRIN